MILIIAGAAVLIALIGAVFGIVLVKMKKNKNGQ